MKIFSSLIVLFLISSSAYAQSAETVAYELNTEVVIQSLRLSATNSNAQDDAITPSIGDIRGSVVCLHLNPAHDYELMVNNHRFITISSEEIRESIQSEEPVSPVILVTSNEFMDIDEE